MMNDKNATELINSLQEGEFRLSIKKTDEGGISINITPISFSESTASTVTLDSTASNRDKIKELLMQMGMKVSNKGYSYLIDAIEYVMSKDKLNESTNISVTKELYPAIAKKFGTTSSRVERAIRHSIEQVYATGREEVVRKVARSAEGGKNKVTNTEFIWAVKEFLK